jgi:HK97 family phage prohead protease
MTEQEKINGTDTNAENRAAPDELSAGDFVRWSASGGNAQGKIERIERDGSISVPDTDFKINGDPEDPAALIRIFRETDEGWQATETLVGHKFSTLSKVADLRFAPVVETREVNLEATAYMKAAARQGLKYYKEGFGGDGLQDKTIREARAMAQGNVTADKWVRMGAWIARHLTDLDAPGANPDNDGYPTPGVVAHLLWGSGPSKSAARRAMEYADGVVASIEAENEGRARGQALSKIETRVSAAEFEIREDGDGMTFEGYAAVFNSPSEPLPFIERIAPGAFRGSLKQRNDIKILWNHDTGSVLGSTRSGTLSLSEDDRGLRVSAKLPNTNLGRDTAELIRRGDIDSMSFGFSTPRDGDTWSADGTERTLNSVRLHEVSIVAFPAYTATAGTTQVRGLDKIALRAEVDADSLADALIKIESGETISIEEKSLITKVLDTLAPDAEQPQDEFDGQAWLNLKKKKLQTLIASSHE